MRDYIKPPKPTCDELYLQACQQMIDWLDMLDGPPNKQHWFYRQIVENIEHYRSFTGVKAVKR